MTAEEHDQATVTDKAILGLGCEPFVGIREQFDTLRGVAENLEKAVDDRALRRIRHIESQLADFSATVTMIGQVKAGKTALINVLAGQPGLLPSDVNPWTSVVTTLHINKPAPRNSKAEFRFFDRGEWERLMTGGGRLGEMAKRAGAADEVREIERQITEVRRKTQERLGKNFELLLGQRHNYDRFDTKLIERYVCLGDPDDPEVQNNKQGRFADLTRSADLYLELPDYPMALSLQDTPGVNDPFLMREQITLREVRNTELCVVVLSANQALNTVDLALIRLLSTLDKRQVIIFVNRIDELDKPSTQVAEIRNSLMTTLTRHGVSGAADIVFGSAKWAEAAIAGDLDSIPDASKESLFDWASVAGIMDDDDADTYAWKLSGMPALMTAIGERVADGAAFRTLQKARKQLKNIVAQSHASVIAGSVQLDGEASTRMSLGDVQSSFSNITRSLQADLEGETQVILGELRSRMKTANETFVNDTVAAMIKHVEAYGAEGQWECDPMRLRMQLRAAYLTFSRATRALSQTVLARASKEISAVYRDLIGEAAADLRLEAPMAPAVPPPVAIGKTIVVDLQSSWWKRWMKLRRGAAAFADDYRAIIAAETAAIVKEIEEQQVSAVNEALRLTLSDFLEDHREALTEIARAGAVDADGLREAIGSQDSGEKSAILDAAMAMLDGAQPSTKLAATR
ncbi:dynamin family protein [Ostreiculturibacter nitratireducens]|uniref:dynamin family protein n=1 Tax=Ostreiculturibacter nitratireducens TaxID=3075226 RepID=UPI0031B5ADD6